MKVSRKQLLCFFLSVYQCIFLFGQERSKANSYLLQDMRFPRTQKDSVRSAQDIIDALKEKTEEQIDTRSINSLAKPPMLQLAIHFNYNSAQLTPMAKEQLDQLGIALQSNELADINIELAGHTDERGSKEYNLLLSRHRVENAKSYVLSKYKIESSRIHAAGYGELEPKIPLAKTEAEHAMNRRVEVKRIEKMNQNFLESFSSANSLFLEQHKLRLEWGIIHSKENGKAELVHYDGTSILKSGDAYKIYLHPNSECYIYIYQVDSKNKGVWLFPRKDIKVDNPLNSNDYWLPSSDIHYTLDQTTGVETVYILASTKPAKDLEALISRNNDHTTVEVTKRIKVRSVGELLTTAQLNERKKQSFSKLKIEHPSETYEAYSPKKIIEEIGKIGDFYFTIQFQHE